MWGGGLTSPTVSHRPRFFRFRVSEISIAGIEILNCTFDPKPLYQRYIQVVVRAILEDRRWSFCPSSLARLL
jgi:hypothetical protein